MVRFRSRSCDFRHTLVGFLLWLVLTQTACQYLQEQKAQREKVQADLAAICEKIRLPDNFSPTDSTKNTDVSRIIFFRNFKSVSACDDIGRHFQNYFIEIGWDRGRMETRLTRGGMETLDFDFRHDDYLISVECQNDVKPSLEKKIVLSCSWGFR